MEYSSGCFFFVERKKEGGVSTGTFNEVSARRTPIECRAVEGATTAHCFGGPVVFEKVLECLVVVIVGFDKMKDCGIRG